MSGAREPFLAEPFAIARGGRSRRAAEPGPRDGRRYALEEGSPGGGRTLAYYADPADALVRRDALRRINPGGRVCFAVIDSDAVDGSPDARQSGELDWCEICGAEPALASAQGCPGCLERAAEIDRNRSRPCPAGCGTQMAVDAGVAACAVCGHEEAVRR